MGEVQLQERAHELHQRLCVVDSMNYTWGPFRALDLPATLTQRLEKLIHAGQPIEEEIDKYILEELLVNEEFRESYIEGWRASGVDVVSVTIGSNREGPIAYETSIQDYAIWERLFAEFSFLKKVTSVRDAIENKQAGYQSIFFNCQNTSFLQGDIGTLNLFYNLGVHIVQLTYNSMNLLGTGCTERVDAGLSHFGVEVVRALNELGILIDLSHCSHRTVIDAVETSTAPVVFTHACCQSVYPHPRAKSDEEIKMVGKTGGYIGIVCVPGYIAPGPERSIQHVVDQISYVVDLVGIEHVGIGSDWGAQYPKIIAQELNKESATLGFRPEHGLDWSETLQGFQSWVEWPSITVELLRRGYSDEEVGKIVGGNFLQILERVLGT